MGRAVDAAAFVDASHTAPDGPLVSRARKRVGSTVRGKWHLDALLGVGGMAAVFAATHRNGRRAALKILHPEVSLEREWRSRLIREGRLANAVGHDGAVMVLDDDVTDDGLVFLVLELLEGEDLEDRCLRLGGRLPEREVLWIAAHLLDILAAAHSRGIVHRDIKPGNLFLTSSGGLKVLDFGIARLRGLSSASAATHNGGTMGTPTFMSPEQARGLWDEVDAQSDIFAVGATMFTLLSGAKVHPGRTPNEEILSAMTVPPRPLSSVAPDVAETVARVIDGALAFEKAGRWPSALHMLEAVRRAYLDREGRPLSMAPRPIVPDSTANAMLGMSTDTELSDVASAAAKPDTGRLRSRPRGIAVALAACAAAVVAVGVVLVRPGGSRAAPGGAGVAQALSVESPAPAAPTRSTSADGPSSSSFPEPRPPASEGRAAGNAGGTTRAPSAPKGSTKAGCATPFVVDPVTHLKHWKLDCL